MRRLFYGLLSALFSVLVAAASVGIKPVCVYKLYQPEVPKALRK